MPANPGLRLGVAAADSVSLSTDGHRARGPGGRHWPGGLSGPGRADSDVTYYTVTVTPVTAAAGQAGRRRRRVSASDSLPGRASNVQ